MIFFISLVNCSRGEFSLRGCRSSFWLALADLVFAYLILARNAEPR